MISDRQHDAYGALSTHLVPLQQCMSAPRRPASQRTPRGSCTVPVAFASSPWGDGGFFSRVESRVMITTDV